MKATAVIVFLIGLGFALNTASCAGKNSCADSAGAGGSSGSAGSGGSGGSSADCSSNASAGSAGAAPTTCGYLTALQICFTAFCKADGVRTPFCTCYGRGYDLDGPPGCSCIPLNPSALCQQAEDRGLDASSVDCAIVTSAIATQCVGVQ